MTTQNNPPAVECYKGKLKAQGSEILCENGMRIGETYKGGDFNYSKSDANAAEIARRWNAHDAHVATIGELREALTAITLIAGNLSDDAITTRTGGNDAVAQGLMARNARAIAQSTLAKSQAKGSL